MVIRATQPHILGRRRGQSLPRPGIVSDPWEPATQLAQLYSISAPTVSRIVAQGVGAFGPSKAR
jgi:hypothetical protein